MKTIISPSILSADFANLQVAVEMLNRSEADWIHVDIMDGVFVPNLSFGLPVTKAIQQHAIKPLDVHLMIVEPDRYLEAFRDAGAHILSVHYEACPHLNRTVHRIKELGCKAGVAINPHTPVHALEDIINEVDIVCLMSVNPGFGGQKFIPASIEKVARLKDLILGKQARTLIEVDGGVDDTNAAQLVAAGAHALVAGNYVFRHPQPEVAIASLKVQSLTFQA